MKKFCFILIAAALLTGGLGGCDFLAGPDEPVGNDGGNLVINFGKGEGRAITSGAELPEEVLAALRYELTLTGPGNEILTRTVTDGETLKLTVALGTWLIDVRAYKEDGLAGTASINLTVGPGVNSVDVPMTLNKGYFDIIIPETDNGTVRAGFNAAFPETTVTLTVTPDKGFVLKSGSLTYNDGSDHVVAGPPYTFTMPASDVTVSAEFDPLPLGTYTIAVADMIHGTVIADKTNAEAGTTITLTVTPDTGYVLKSGSLIYNDGSDHVVAGPPYTFTMPASHVTISAEFEPLPPDTYSITVDSTISNGTVITDKTNAEAGTTIALTVTPDPGYVLKSGSLIYNDGSDHVVAGPPYVFTMPASHVTISAFFNAVVDVITIEGPQDAAVTVTALHNRGGSSTVISWLADDSVTFTVDDPAYTEAAGNLMWFVEGARKTGDGNSLTINAKDYIKRKYSLTVMIKLNDQWYSTDAGFTIVD